MKFSIGYQLGTHDAEPFPELVTEFREHIAEVYFATPGMPSGRAPLPDDPASRERFERDLAGVRELGISLNLLINANCFGGLAMSRTLEQCVLAELERLREVAGGADSVTTTSPAIAAILKRHAPTLPVRASVNMRIGSVQGMSYLADLFDGYYVQRDFNRDLAHLARLKEWADARGKTLHLLANSGCLRFCPAQTFHDNLVAHEPDVAAEDNIPGFVPYACWNHLRERAHWVAVLQGTWIRPEDLHHYETLFPVAKLATRLHERPWTVMRAYAQGRYEGNLLDLLEPGFSKAFAPCVLDNRRFPADWFAKTTSCGGRCEACTYCAIVLESALVRLG